MLPGKLDMSRDECRKYLRSLELDAYSSMVSVLRAQGPFTNDKRKLLEELSGVLHISNERHRAEIRRAVNDDRLTTVAEQLTGPNTGTDWATEGRRIVPLIPRLKARNAFTTLANTLSLVTAMANQKQPLPEKNIKDLSVKMETDSDFQPIFLSEEETSTSSSIETEFNDKKRKRSVTESSDTEGSTYSREKLNKSDYTIVPNLNPDDVKLPLLSSPSCSKDLEISTSLGSLDTLRHSVSDKTLPEESKNVDSSTNVVTLQNVTVIPVGVGNVATSSTVSFIDANSIATAQNVQQTSVSASPCIGSAINSKINLLPSQVKTAVVGPRRISVTMPPNIAQPTTSKIEQVKPQTLQTNSDKDIKIIPVTNNVYKAEIEKLENAVNKITHVVPTSVNITEPQTILDINARVTIVTSSSSNSSSSVLPCVTASPTTLTCKTVSPVKPNSHPKMISLNSKTISIDPKSKANFGGKRNLIVLQKGMKRVMLSHGGKEARGKLISSVALVPRVPPNNGDQNESECTKLINKPGSKMVVLDIRQDVLEKNRIFPQRLEAPSVTDESKTTPLITANSLLLNEQNISKSTTMEKDSQLNNSSVLRLINNENEESHKMSPRNIFEDADLAAVIEKASDKEPLFLCNDRETIVEGTLDPQTGIYEIQSSDAIKNVQCEETLSSEEVGHFYSTLETEIINSDNSQCTEGTNNSCINEETNNPLLSAK